MCQVLVDTWATHNLLAKEEANALGVKYTKATRYLRPFNAHRQQSSGRSSKLPFVWVNGGKLDIMVDIDDLRQCLACNLWERLSS